VGVAHVVETDPLHARQLDKALELTGDHVGVVWGAVRPAQDQAVSAIGVRPAPTLEVLGGAMALQHLEVRDVDLDGAPAGQSSSSHRQPGLGRKVTFAYHDSVELSDSELEDIAEDFGISLAELKRLRDG
jgi:hypothetical protein